MCVFDTITRLKDSFSQVLPFGLSASAFFACFSKSDLDLHITLFHTAMSFASNFPFYYPSSYLSKELIFTDEGLHRTIFTANETITNPMQYELSQEESDLLKSCLYFPIQPDKIRKSEILTTFEKIHRLFLNNLKSEETKSQIKSHLSYIAHSYFYNYKPSPSMLRQHHVLRNLKRNKDVVITKPHKGNGVVILDRKLYHNANKEIISDTSKFEKLNEATTLKRETSLERSLRKLKQKKKI